MIYASKQRYKLGGRYEPLATIMARISMKTFNKAIKADPKMISELTIMSTVKTLK